jgi:phosphotransferase system enzyme I (PtsI)
MKQVEDIRKLKGIAVSPGIIIGKARLIDRSKVKIFYQYLIHEEQVNREVERFRDALETTKNQIIKLKDRMPDQIKQHAFILDAHLMILDDSMLNDATIKAIKEEKTNAEWALKKSIQNIRQLFDQIEDEYIRERFSDVENVAERILRNLAGQEQEDLLEISERVIIVAHDLSPVDTSGMNVGKVMGFITDVGGRTSHSAIVAHSLKIPAVVGLESVSHQVQDGTLLIVDGNSGEVIIGPDDETIIQYQEKQIQHEEYESSIAGIGRLPAETLDGHKITVEANIEFLEEVVLAKDHGAEGIGLYRTEYLYLRSKGIPDEDELFQDYKEVAENMAPNPVTIRTLDLEGNKFSTLALKAETNPALGLRAIRFCLKEQKIFRSQLRAILRASAYGKIRLMFPMISGLQEIHESREILNGIMEELDHEKIPYDQDMEVGIMIEIPSAVAVSDILAKHVDFFSIGTNDLIQYALAIDRVNEHVAYMYKPFHPAILRMIQQAVKAANKAGIPVALCGEMAADPLCAFVLLGLDIEGLSMNAGGIPGIKKIIRSISIKDSKAALKHIFKLETAEEVREYISKKVAALLPDFEGIKTQER